MNKETIVYDTPLDALLAITKRLVRYETDSGMTSEVFFERYSRGQLGDDVQFVDWANDYRHYQALRQEVERLMRAAA